MSIQELAQNYDPINIPQIPKWEFRIQTERNYQITHTWNEYKCLPLDASFNYSLLCLFIMPKKIFHNFFTKHLSSIEKSRWRRTRNIRRLKMFDTLWLRQLICIFSPSEIEWIDRKFFMALLLKCLWQMPNKCSPYNKHDNKVKQ